MPACFEVFAARYDGDKLAALSTHRCWDSSPGEPPPDSPLGDRDGYTAVFAVGHLILKVFGRDVEGIYGMQHHQSISQAVCRQYPPRKRFVFPTTARLGNRGVEVFMGNTLV